jgi:hypothetical protein
MRAASWRSLRSSIKFHPVTSLLGSAEHFVQTSNYRRVRSLCYSESAFRNSHQPILVNFTPAPTTLFLQHHIIHSSFSNNGVHSPVRSSIIDHLYYLQVFQPAFGGLQNLNSESDMVIVCLFVHYNNKAGYTTFTAVPSKVTGSTITIASSLARTLESAVYNCPCANTSDLRSSMTRSNVSPWQLLNVVA